MRFKQFTAALTAATLLLGVAATPVLAKGKPEKQDKHRVSDSYGDMDEYDWGLKDVIKLSLKGIFQGRGEGVFAPGAKITHQETAVALVRLMDREDEAKALTEATIAATLSGMVDAAKIAEWARSSVALLVREGVLTEDQSFAPTAETTRVELAVLLVKALGYQAEAEEKAHVELAFKDAHLIPAEAVGYVATAVDHKLITGYDDKSFRPNQAVKRVEMAVMMGRAQQLIGDERPNSYQGVITAVDADDERFVLQVEGRSITLTLADDASVFVDGVERDLEDLAAGMRVDVQLNQAGEALFVEATSQVGSPTEGRVEGKITYLRLPSQNVLALVKIDGRPYLVSAQAEITLNGQTARLADLAEGDAVTAMTSLGLIHSLKAVRTTQPVVERRTGTVSRLVAATGSSPAKLTLTYPSFTTPAATEEFTVPTGVTIKINGKTARFAELRVGDSADLTLTNGKVTQVEATRIALTVQGTIAELVAATGQSPAKITVVETSGAVRQYVVAQGAVVSLNGSSAQFQNLQVGDQVVVTIGSDQVDKIQATRTTARVIEGKIAALSTSTNTRLVGLLSVTQTVDGKPVVSLFEIPVGALLRVNARSATFADLRLLDSVRVTLQNEIITQVDVTR